VVVEGEAGIGKSRLLAEALEAARERGLEVVAGRGQDLERNRPFGLLADSLGCSRSSPDPRRVAIAALLATHDGDRGVATVSSDPGLQFQAVDAFLELVEALALRGPLVLGLDDLQWADPSSLLTLGALARRLTGSPVALLASLRPLPRGAELERTLEALDAAGARRLTLGQLDPGAMAELVAGAVGAEPGPRLMAEVAAAGGNPLFVTELLAALLHEGTIQVAHGRAEVAETTLPPSLRLTILRRLSFLPDDTLEALRPASILGSSFSLTDLSATTGRSVLELSSVLAEAMRARVLEDDGDRLRFRHDLIHEAIYEDLPASVRLALHREAGRRLAEAGAEAVAVAEHLARGATPGDREAVAWPTRPTPGGTGCWPTGPARSCGRGGCPRPRRPSARCWTASTIRRWRPRPASCWRAPSAPRDGCATRSGSWSACSGPRRSARSCAPAPPRPRPWPASSWATWTAPWPRPSRHEAWPWTATTRRSSWPRPRWPSSRSSGPTWAGRSASQTRRCGWPTTAPSGGGTRRSCTWPGGTSSSGWTGWRTPGPPSRPAGGSARSSASAGGSPCTRPSWRCGASWPASGTTPSPSSRRPGS
jgi:hypothetical protein